MSKKSDADEDADANAACPPAPKYGAIAARFFETEEAYDAIPMPETMSRMLKRSRPLPPAHASKSGGSGMMQHFIGPQSSKPWMFVQKMDALTNHTSQDATWSGDLQEDRPCFEIKGKKIAKSKKVDKCGHETLTGHPVRTFEWSDVYIMVFDKNPEHPTSAEKAFFKTAFHVCHSCFSYHCTPPEGDVGVGKGYFTHTAWDAASHVAMVISDCGRSTKDDECAFLVLGFALLQNISGKSRLFVAQPKLRPEALVFNPKGLMPENQLYIDIICSKFSMAQHLMTLFCKPSPLGPKWKRLVFGEGKEMQGHYVQLRALSSVYTYYPIKFGFIRSKDNASCYPIFKVAVGKLSPFRTQTQTPTMQTLQTIFGEPVHPATQTVHWVRRGNVVRVYRIGEAFLQFMKTHKLKNEDRKKHFPEVPFVCHDSDANGYLYGRYVA